MKLVIAIGVHSSKPGMFTFDERRDLINQVVPAALASRVSVISFDNLTTDAAVEAGASMMIRGVRDGSDLDYEMQLAGMNGALNENLQTVFLPASPRYPTHHRHIGASGCVDGRRCLPVCT